METFIRFVLASSPSRSRISIHLAAPETSKFFFPHVFDVSHLLTLEKVKPRFSPPPSSVIRPAFLPAPSARANSIDIEPRRDGEEPVGCVDSFVSLVDALHVNEVSIETID